MRYFRTLLLALFLLAASCGKNNQADLSSQIAQSFLHISFRTEVRSLDPRIGVDFPSAHAIKMLFEGLTRINLNGMVEPAIAKSYTISEDHKTYTFYLRDAKWSNGDPVVASDFVYAWKKVVNPNEIGSLGIQNLYPIKNVHAIFRGEKPLDSIGVRVIDDSSLQVELEHPTPYFLELLATPSLMPINARIDRENPDWAIQKGSRFVCNGPFMLHTHHMDNEIVVVKNSLYWDEASVKLPGIHIAIIKDPTTQLNMFEKKDLDWLGNPLSKLPLDAIEHLKKNNRLHFLQSLGAKWLFINVKAFPFHNKKMRKAFALAVNRDSLTKFVTQQMEQPATGVLPYSLATQAEPYFQDNHLELARKLFDEALDELGLTKEELPNLTINTSDEPVTRRIAEALQQQWKVAFDLFIQLEQQEWKVHYSKLQKGNFQIGGMGWFSTFRDPICTLQTFREKDDGLNMSNWESPLYQNLLYLAQREIDPEKRKEYFHQAETHLIDEMPVIPICFTNEGYAVSDRLKNFYLSELKEVDFRWAYLTDARTE